MVCCGGHEQRRVLVVGGGFAGLCVARDLKKEFLVTVVDAKEYFEYTPGVLRAYVKPEHLDHLTFNLQPVIERRMGCKFIWGEVTKLDGPNKRATVKPMFTKEDEIHEFDFCIIASGCNFNPLHKKGESLWFPTVHHEARPSSSWPHIDERFLEGRRRHILEEYGAIKALNDKESTVLVVGAGFIGVEWVTELRHYFPKLKNTIIDFLPNPLGPLPKKAAEYCKQYMENNNINQFYGLKYAPDDDSFWTGIKLPGKADKEYICIGVKASNYFMPEETLSLKGPGGGGWIHMDMTLAVCTKDMKLWSKDEAGNSRVFAIGDCNTGGISEPGKKDPGDWPMPPIPKISYPGEEQAVIACKNIVKIDKKYFRRKSSCFGSLEQNTMHWPWGAGMFATSLGPNDACFVVGANWEKGSGYMVVWGWPCALQKWIIEATKVEECADGLIGKVIWHFVHHTPVHLWGGGPRWGY